MSTIQLHCGDCRQVMATMPEASIDLILADLPYGTTACAWDQIISFDELWPLYRRVLKPRGAVVLTASQPFTTALIASNLRQFRYCWYWRKNRGANFQHARTQPIRVIEEVCVFGGSTYRPQGVRRYGKVCRNSRSAGGGVLRDTNKQGGALRTPRHEYMQEFTNYPANVLEFAADDTKVHPTQKPVALMEYLTLTYSNEGDTILDNTMGSGTTGVACVNTGRNFIGIELDPATFADAEQRIADARLRLDRPHAPALRLREKALDGPSLFDAQEARR